MTVFFKDTEGIIYIIAECEKNRNREDGREMRRKWKKQSELLKRTEKSV